MAKIEEGDTLLLSDNCRLSNETEPAHNLDLMSDNDVSRSDSCKNDGRESSFEAEDSGMYSTLEADKSVPTIEDLQTLHDEYEELNKMKEELKGFDIEVECKRQEERLESVTKKRLAACSKLSTQERSLPTIKLKPPRLKVFKSSLQWVVFDERLRFKDLLPSGRLSFKLQTLGNLSQPQMLDMMGSVQLQGFANACPALMRWAFYMMTVHPDSKQRSYCSRFILKVWYENAREGMWFPTSDDVYRVLLNFGMQPDTLVDLGIRVAYLNSLKLKPIDPWFARNTSHAASYKLSTDVVKKIIETLNHAVSVNKAYHLDDLKMIFIAVLILILNESHKREYDFVSTGRDAIVTVLQSLNPEDYVKFEKDCIAVLLRVFRHHHHRLEVVKMVLKQEFRLKFAVVALCSLLGLPETPYPEDSDKAFDMLALLVTNLRVKDNTNWYEFYSIIQLFDYAVGAEVDLDRKEALLSVKQGVRRVSCFIKDNDLDGDCGECKKMAMHVLSRWDQVANTRLEEGQVYHWSKGDGTVTMVQPTAEATSTSSLSDESERMEDL